MLEPTANEVEHAPAVERGHSGGIVTSGHSFIGRCKCGWAGGDCAQPSDASDQLAEHLRESAADPSLLVREWVP